jgi:hypothetical protein
MFVQAHRVKSASTHTKGGDSASEQHPNSLPPSLRLASAHPRRCQLSAQQAPCRRSAAFVRWQLTRRGRSPHAACAASLAARCAQPPRHAALLAPLRPAATCAGWRVRACASMTPPAVMFRALCQRRRRYSADAPLCARLGVCAHAASFVLRGADAGRLSAGPRRASRRAASGVCEARRSGGDDSPNVAERIVAALPYVLPLLDGLRYSACACGLRRLRRLRSGPFRCWRAALTRGALRRRARASLARRQVLLPRVPAGQARAAAVSAGAVGAWRVCAS